jgi:hypothetical protein
MTVDPRALPALLCATVADQYLRMMRAATFNPSDSRLADMRASIVRLMWADWRGRY